MAIKTVKAQIDEHKASPVAASMNEEMQRLNQDVLKSLVDIKKRYVKFSGSTNSEFILTLIFAAEGLTPIWLGGTEYPGFVGANGSPATPAPEFDSSEIDAQIKLALERIGRPA